MARTHPTDAFLHPQRDWACGLAGTPCRFGPEAGGRCPERSECQPRRQDDRWLCTRPVARGGPCRRGPEPDGSCGLPQNRCVPRASPRRRRRQVTGLALLLAAGLGLALFSSASQVDPGPLIAPHAGLADNCGACHIAGDDPSLRWVTALGHSGLFGDAIPMANAELCAACHDFGVAGSEAHSVAASALPPPAATPVAGSIAAPVTLRDLELRFTGALARTRPGPAAWTDGRATGAAEGVAPIPCATCHEDHGGRDNPAMTAMTDTACQACHQATFAGFTDHPPFAGFPHRPAAAITFHHGTHYERHFPDSERRGTPPPESCSACHTPDPADRTGGSMAVGGFETCAACHLADILDPPGGEPFLAVLAPPGLDLVALSGAGIGDWPYFAEAELGPFLRLMLDAGGYLDADDLDRLAALDLFDLLDVDDADRQAVARLAWAFKELTRDLVAEGPELLVAMARELHGDRPALDWSSLAAAMPYESVAAAARIWFPALDEELDRRGSGEVPTRMLEGSFAEIDGFEELEDWLRHGGWGYRQLALVYRPTGHGDRFLQGWMELATASGAGPAELFDFLTGDEAPADCARCHVSERPGGGGAGTAGSAVLRWYALDAGMEADAGPVRAGNRWHLRNFSHLSHRQALAGQDCTGCHLPTQSGRGTGLAPLTTATCAACHGEESGLDTCLSCHLYHFAANRLPPLRPTALPTATE